MEFYEEKACTYIFLGRTWQEAEKGNEKDKEFPEIEDDGLEIQDPSQRIRINQWEFEWIRYLKWQSEEMQQNRRFRLAVRRRINWDIAFR